MVRRRYVYFVAGYDPIAAEWQHKRFLRELATFAKTWNVAAQASELERAPPRWTVAAQGGNWTAETVYAPLMWDDLILASLAKPMIGRLGRSFAACLSFFGSGAVFRYFWANWKYAAFFLFPYFMVALFAAVALLLANWIAGAANLVGWPRFLAVLVVGALLFLGTLRTLGRRWRVEQALDDWIFSHDYLHGQTPELDARLNQFAHELIARSRDESCDEVVVVGHSMGAIVALDIVARALLLDPQLGRRGRKFCVLTVGSTIPKFTLAPAADRIRAFVAKVAQAGDIDWAEYHARDDVISFYKFDPVAGVKFDGERMDSRPIIRRCQLHDMLEPETFRRYRWKFMRMHYQFVMANERRAIYDYFMMICGPVPLAKLIRSPRGPLDFIAEDGALIDGAAEASRARSLQ